MENITVSVEVDALGKRCPMPILAMKKALAKLPQGQVLSLKTDDPHALSDVQAFCRQTKHPLLDQVHLEDDVIVHYVQRRFDE